MANIVLDNVTKRFGSVTAINGLSLDIRHGEFFCVLGPPGAGKTTTLRLIVGLERPDVGTITIDGELANDIHPGKRDIAMMFQNLALYPDKTVFDNIAYPLRERKLPKAEIQARVTEVAKSLYIDQLLARKPAKLSGGERQRVALGRAMVRRPRATLMDEPLANLDALLRLEMRVELKNRQKEEGSTLVYVTHDQVEAMSMADRIAVLNHGVLQQCDIPDVIYGLPTNRFVATVIGSPPTNFMPAEVCRDGADLLVMHPAFTLRAAGAGHPLAAVLDSKRALTGQTLVGVRPEDITVLTENPVPAQALPAQVSVLEPLGGETIVELLIGLKSGSGHQDIIKAVIPPVQVLREGQDVWVRFDPDRIHLFDAASGARLYTTGQTARLAVEGITNFGVPNLLGVRS
jgi:multiple sugar transport system ATP-binding protein